MLEADGSVQMQRFHFCRPICIMPSEMSTPVMDCGESLRADKMAKSPVPVATSKIRRGERATKSRRPCAANSCRYPMKGNGSTGRRNERCGRTCVPLVHAYGLRPCRVLSFLVRTRPGSYFWFKYSVTFFSMRVAKSSWLSALLNFCPTICSYSSI